ncbi:SLAM family member 5-like isoform X2 [Sander lucioperca]|uniref:SLAM family member 5-like isoform X2 n=1 Tax=Sander lucioperca TaxID=283035 RepID=UPI00125DC013|nr:SLAM family member 5-like isoform X2 [Sander lucioperca]
MAGGCLSCFFTYISVLLLGVCLHDVKASSCQLVIHKKVGDTVEFSSCSPTEGVTLAKWKYKGSIIADKYNVSVEHQFKGRLDLNPTNFSLTVRRLTLKDSGDFSFLSEGKGGSQRGTDTFTLKVHEPITVIIVSNSTWHTLNESCTVLLECQETSDITNSDITYTWAVRNQTIGGPRLEYIITPQDEDTKFTCTISNHVSNMSATETVKCSPGPHLIVLLSVTGVGCVLIVVIVGVTVCVCHRKQRQEVVDSNDLTVYADISDVAIEDGTMKPCTLYETIDHRIDTVTPGPQTVYDKIQVSRMRKASVSPYQEIS